MRPRLFVLCLIATQAISLQSTADEFLRDNNLRVISYNVQFLPGLAGAVANKRGNPVYRAKTIGQKLVDFDIIGLNELFDEKPRELLVGEIRKSWGENLNVVVSPRVNPKRFTGGLAIITRLPILADHVLTYSQSSSPEKYGLGADGYATKGALHARLALDSSRSAERAVDVFVTHMEAREDALRPSQYEELARFVSEHTSPIRPAIMMGDFNTHGDREDMDDPSSPYNLMVGKFAAARPESRLIDLWPTLHDGPGGTSRQEGDSGGSRIDYIFVLNPKQPAPMLQPKSVQVNRYLDPKVVALSDHSAVEAELIWKLVP